MPELETRAEPDDADRSASYPERGLTTAEVAERVARGEVNDVPAAPTRTVAQIVRGNIFTRFNAILGAMLAIILVVGSVPGRVVRVRADRERAIGIVPGTPGQADPRPLTVLTAPKARVVRDGEVQSSSPSASVVLDDVLAGHGGDGDRGGRRRARQRRHGGRRIAADRRIRTGRQGAGRRRDVRVVRRRRFGALPRDQGGQGGLRGAAGAGRAPVHAHQVGTAQRHRQRSSPTSRSRSSPPRRCCSSPRSAPATATGVRRSRAPSPAPSRWCPRAGAADLAGVRGGRACGSRANGCWCRNFPPSKGSRASTCSASTRPARSRRASSSVEARRTMTGQDDEPAADGARGARGRRRLAQRHDARDRATRFDSPPAWTADARRCRSPALASGAAPTSAPTGRGCSVRPTCVLRVDRRARRAARTRRRPVERGQARRAAGLGGPRSTATRCRGDLEPVALVILGDLPRPDAADTLRYFREQDVTVKVISGDDPRTVGAIARELGLPDADEPVDARDALGRRRRRTRRHARVPRGVRPRHAAAEAGDGAGAAGARPHGRDDRRRRERRARAEGRRHRRRDGVGQRCHPRRSRNWCCWTPTSTRCRPWWPKAAASWATSSARAACT